MIAPINSLVFSLQVDQSWRPSEKAGALSLGAAPTHQKC